MSLGALEDGWHELNRQELCKLQYFGKNNNEVQIVHNVCYNSLLCAGDLIIRVGKDAKSRLGPGDGTRLIFPNQEEEERMHAQSVIYSEWARECALLDDCIGFVPSRGLEMSNGEMKPVVMNIERMRILHHVDVDNQHNWRFFEEISPKAFMSIDIETRGKYPNLRELFDIKVIGSHLPGNDGQINSKVKRIMNSEWEFYQHKKKTTMLADTERSHPTLVTQMLEVNNEACDATPSADPIYDQSVAIERGRRERRVDMMTAQIIHSKNTTQSIRRDHENMESDDKEYEISHGRTYVNAHMAEAPLDVSAVRQAYFESCCLTWSIPMTMLSSGDTSSKAKIGQSAASPETARIFREAQSDRKVRLECNIRDMYQHMCQTRHAQQYVETQVTARYHELQKKRKRDPDYSELLEDDDEADFASVQAIEEHTSVHVCIPSSASSENMFELLREGIIRYDDFCKYNSKQNGIPLTSYNRKQFMTMDAMLINGCAPKPEPAAGAPRKKSKA